MTRYFTKEDTQMTNKHMKRYSTSLPLGKSHKTMVRYHCIPIRMAKMKKKMKMLNDDKDAGNLDLSYITGENVK